MWRGERTRAWEARTDHVQNQGGAEIKGVQPSVPPADEERVLIMAFGWLCQARATQDALGACGTAINLALFYSAITTACFALVGW